MNNSLHRLIDGMVATLRTEVMAHVDTEFARGQLFGVIYMLNSIQLRAEWSTRYFHEQLAAQAELRDTLQPLLETLLEPLDRPALPEAAKPNADSPALEALCDANDELVCQWIAWLPGHAAQIGTQGASAINAALHHYMNRQLKFELSTTAKPMFAEMSSGAE